MSLWTFIPLAWCVAAFVMVVLWHWAERNRNASIVDVAWAVLIGVFVLAFSLASGGNGMRRTVVAGLGLLWSFRLSAYLLSRIRKLPEDGRYEELRRRWGHRAARNFFVFFQAQAFWSVLFATPILASLVADRPLDLWDAAGVMVGVGAVLGERAADGQLDAFRRKRENRGSVCRAGLWKYSRHPNYFFEWLHWWAYVLIGWDGAAGAVTFAGPVIMLVFLFFITGIGPTEENALRTRGEAYREYRRTTSTFVPWPPKKSGIEAR